MEQSKPNPETQRATAMNEQRDAEGLPPDETNSHEAGVVPYKAVEQTESPEPTPRTADTDLTASVSKRLEEDARNRAMPTGTAVGNVPPHGLLDEAAHFRTIVTQLGKTVPRSRGEADVEEIAAAVDAYQKLNPQDPAEEALCKSIVAVTNVSLESLGQTTRNELPQKVREQHFKLGLKGVHAIAELVKVLDARRGRGPANVNVGQVNVQSGGRAIVGNVSQPKPEEDRPRSDDEDTDDGEEAA